MIGEGEELLCEQFFFFGGGGVASFNGSGTPPPPLRASRKPRYRSIPGIGRSSNGQAMSSYAIRK